MNQYQQFQLSNNYYHATIWRDGKVVAQLKGKTNTESMLASFLKEHWPYDLKWHVVPAGRATYKLEVKKYWGQVFRGIQTLAQSPGA